MGQGDAFIITDDLSYLDVAVYGEALSTRGLEVRGAIDGAGLSVRGLFWFGPQIWTDTTVPDAITSTWTQSAGSGASTTTNWTQSSGSGASTTTTWTALGKGFNGEY